MSMYVFAPAGPRELRNNLLRVAINSRSPVSLTVMGIPSAGCILTLLAIIKAMVRAKCIRDCSAMSKVARYRILLLPAV